MVRKGISSRTNFWVFQLNPHSYQVVALYDIEVCPLTVLVHIAGCKLAYSGFEEYWNICLGADLGCDKVLVCFTFLDKKQVFGYPKNYVNAMRIVDGDIGLEEAYW
ncbi:hypothetical protein V6N13_073070 [Hibiscus sabdariffa]